MAGAAVIGALRVVLGADTAAFEKAMGAAQKKVSEFGDTAAKQAVRDVKLFGVALAGVALAIGASIKSTIDEMDKINKASQKFGVPVEEFTKLKYAADLSDISMEDLGKSIGKLSKNMAEIAQGSGDQAKRAFEALGLSSMNADGSLKSSSQVMEEVAGKFGKMEDGAGKTALAMQLFGRSGAALIPMLNQGKEGLAALNKEAEELGLVFDRKTSQAAEDFNDNMTRMGKIWDGIIIKVTAEMLPAFKKLSEQLLEFSKDPEKVRAAADLISTGLEKMVIAAIAVPTVFQNAFEKLRLMYTLIDAAMSTNGQTLREWKAEWDQVSKENAERWDGLTITVTKFFTTLAGLEEERRNKPPPPLGPNQDEVKRMTAAYDEMNAAAQRMFEEVRTPAEQYQFRLAEIKAALESGGISAETYALQNELAAQRVGATWTQAGGSLAGSFASIANSMGRENSRMATAAKAFAIVAAIISAYEGAAKAMTLPFPANFAASAAVLAKGFAFVAAIRSQNVPHFATGGSFRVGGVGGMDSQMIPIMATPGEQVDIWKPGERGSDPRGGGRSINITLQGEGYSQKMVRKLITSINEAIGDGARLKVA